MDRCRVGSVELEWDQTGAGEPVLLIHGVPATTFRPLMGEATLGSYRLIRYHRRNWAGSSGTGQAVTIGDHAADALGLLAELEVRRAHVVGHSYGALVALQLAVDAGDGVGSLALLEPNLLVVPSAAAFNDQVRPAFAAYRAGDKAEAVARFFAVVAGRPWKQCEAIIEERIPGGVAEAVADADTFFGIDIPALRGWSFDDQSAARISCPVLSVLGADTHTLFRDGNQQLHRWFPHLEQADVADAGHLLPLENPAGAAAALAGFFARHPLAPTA